MSSKTVEEAAFREWAAINQIDCVEIDALTRAAFDTGFAAGTAHGAAEERGAALEMIIMCKEAQHGCPKRTHYPASRCIICEVYDDLEARIRQRGEK